MTYYLRRQWGARKRRHHPGRLDPDQVEGIALHWPAITKPLTTVAAVKAAMRGWQDYHMDGQGWSDLGYQLAIDQAGNRYRARGLRNRSAANGDYDLNSRFGAFLLILAPGEEPSPAMIRQVRRHIRAHRRRFRRSSRIVGHGQIRPGGTLCPGPAVQRLINRGTFDPAKPYRSPK